MGGLKFYGSTDNLIDPRLCSRWLLERLNDSQRQFWHDEDGMSSMTPEEREAIKDDLRRNTRIEVTERGARASLEQIAQREGVSSSAVEAYRQEVGNERFLREALASDHMRMNASPQTLQVYAMLLIAEKLDALLKDKSNA